jgi:radical SAM protein with 4Fe4S-binding SPASM domain
MAHMTETYFTEIPDVGVDITNRCNLSCRHCYNDSGQAPVMELKLAELIGLFDQLQSFGQRTLQISGGEPTMHPDFPAIVREAQKRRMKVSINTNGTFSPQVREQLRDLDIWRMAVSLDGLRENNDRIRGRGVFDKVLDSVRFLKNVCSDVLLAVHVCRSNQTDAEPLIYLARELGVGIKFSTLRPVGRAKEQMKGEIPSPQEYLGVVRTVSRMRKVYPGTLIQTDFDILGQGLNALRPVPPSRASCPAGRSRLNVSFDGYVYPCSFLATPQREFAIGKLSVDGSILELWRNSPVLEPFRNIRKSRTCQSCVAYGSTCVGGCVAMAYFETGQLAARDPICFVEHLTPSELDQGNDKGGSRGTL